MTSTGINIVYSTKGSATIVDSFSVNLFIFDGYNPGFRYVEGVVSQTYVSAVMGLKIPDQGISEMRTFLTGLTSFEVNSNVAISLYSDMNSNFEMHIGPNSNECEINMIAISYIILSVYPECGACGPNTISLNGKCVPACPDGDYIKAGKCEPKACQPGFYLSGNACLKCPKYSDIK